jgi:imidazoleglycerol-phosphate dehydratase
MGFCSAVNNNGSSKIGKVKMSIIRSATVERNTKETQITVSLNLDGEGKSDINIGIPFLEHMLDQIARHGIFDLKIQAKGDLQIDAHHTVEDVGITLGQALAEAMGDKTGIRRYGYAYTPLDEALSRVVLDCSGRPGLEYAVDYPRARVGEFDVDLLFEFFQGLINHAFITLHIDNIRGKNAHHIAETIFKAFGRALHMAVERDPRIEGILPSTKGSL